MTRALGPTCRAGKWAYRVFIATSVVAFRHLYNPGRGQNRTGSVLTLTARCITFYVNIARFHPPTLSDGSASCAI